MYPRLSGSTTLVSSSMALVPPIPRLTEPVEGNVMAQSLSDDGNAATGPS
jgi:hypothetical protein